MHGTCIEIKVHFSLSVPKVNPTTDYAEGLTREINKKFNKEHERFNPYPANVDKLVGSCQC